MQAANFEQSVQQIVAGDPRYRADAYFFVRDALDYTKRTVRRNLSDPKHVTGKELLEGIRALALDSYGPMALALLEEWGIRCCEDFGEIVFNLIERNLLAKSQTDSRADFKNGYDFEEAFRKPFLPSKPPLSNPKSVKV